MSLGSLSDGDSLGLLGVNWTNISCGCDYIEGLFATGGVDAESCDWLTLGSGDILTACACDCTFTGYEPAGCANIGRGEVFRDLASADALIRGDGDRQLFRCL